MRNKNETKSYLIGIGCDIALANYLSKKHDLAKLKELTLDELQGLGLSDTVAENIKTRRKPIPFDILDSVLTKNLRICCVCYNENRSVVLHHIKPYAKEKKHEESNLAALCLQCHGKAHTRHDSEQNLDELRLLAHKKSWEAAVAHRKTWVLASPKNWNSETRWDWINFHRLQDALLKEITRGNQLPTSEQGDKLKQCRFLASNGYTLENLATKKEDCSNYFSDIGQHQHILTAYLSQLIEWLADHQPVFDATDHCSNPKLLQAVLCPEMYFCIWVDFSVSAAPLNTIQGVGRNKKVTILFPFDAFNCTTSTSRSIASPNSTSQLVAFGTVRSINYDKYSETVCINMSPIGLAQRFSPNDYFEPGFFQSA